MNFDTRDHRANLRAAYIQLACQFDPNTFVTLAANATGNLNELTCMLDRFCGMMDRKLLGHKFHKLAPDQRSDGIFFVEHTASNIHAHGLVAFRNPKKVNLAELTATTWNRLTKAGTSEVVDIYDASRCASYCTKEMRGSFFDPDQAILVRQFMKG